MRYILVRRLCNVFVLLILLSAVYVADISYADSKHPQRSSARSLILPGSEFELAAALGAETADNVDVSFDGRFRYGVSNSFQLMFPLLASFDAFPVNEKYDLVFTGGINYLGISSSFFDVGFRGALSFKGGGDSLSFSNEVYADIIISTYTGDMTSTNRVGVVGAVVFSPLDWLTLGIGSSIEVNVDRSDLPRCKIVFGSIVLTPAGTIPLITFHLFSGFDLIVLLRMNIVPGMEERVDFEALGGIAWRF